MSTTLFRVQLAKLTANGWDLNHSSGQLEHMASYHATKAEAEAVAEKLNAKLMSDYADGSGLTVEECEDQGRMPEQYYHVTEE